MWKPLTECRLDCTQKIQYNVLVLNVCSGVAHSQGRVHSVNRITFISHYFFFHNRSRMLGKVITTVNECIHSMTPICNGQLWTLCLLPIVLLYTSFWINGLWNLSRKAKVDMNENKSEALAKIVAKRNGKRCQKKIDKETIYILKLSKPSQTNTSHKRRSP